MKYIQFFQVFPYTFRHQQNQRRKELLKTVPKNQNKKYKSKYENHYKESTAPYSPAKECLKKGKKINK